MLDIKFIVNNPDVVKKAVRDKNMEVDIDRLLSVYEDVRAVTSQVDSLRASGTAFPGKYPSFRERRKKKGIAGSGT